jgi:hypothetical protein
MQAPGLLFLALYGKVPSLDGAYVVTDFESDITLALSPRLSAGVSTGNAIFRIIFIYTSSH